MAIAFIAEYLERMRLTMDQTDYEGMLYTGACIWQQKTASGAVLAGECVWTTMSQQLPGGRMPRRRKANYFRSLTCLVPAVLAGGGALFINVIDGVRCSLVPKTIDCPGTIPDWGYLAAIVVVVASFLWTCWAWYKDHVRGDYLMDVMHGIDRYRD